MPSLKLYDAQSAHTYAVRLFILERGSLTLDVEQVDIFSLDNRKRPYLTSVNSRGELPALRVDEKTVITEISAICEYLDEIASQNDPASTSLFGKDPLERAETRMWLRRMDLELAQPIILWYRNDPATVDFYKGDRLPIPEARFAQKITINQYLNLLDDELEGKDWLCGERFSAADTHFYGLVKMMLGPVEWVLDPARRNVKAYFDRMDGRKASQEALKSFGEKLKV